jgi:hypothetical protein
VVGRRGAVPVLARASVGTIIPIGLRVEFSESTRFGLAWVEFADEVPFGKIIPVADAPCGDVPILVEETVWDFTTIRLVTDCMFRFG